MKTITLSANTSWYLYNFRASTIRRLVDDGYSVVCISPDDGYGQKLEAQFGCRWLPLKMDNRGSNPLKDLLLVFRFWRYYRRIKPVAALHFTIKNNIYGTWAARVRGIPAINNVSGLGTAFIRSGPVERIVRLLYRLSQPLAHTVFCQNEEDYRLLIDRNMVPAAHLQLLPGSGVDTQRFHPGLRQPHASVFRFLYAGRMLADKGLYELIEAHSKINRDGVVCELWLCGFTDVQNVSALSGAQLSEWEDLPGVCWLGPTDDMLSVYAKVDCVVLPSYREGMPRSLIEAGAVGLPSITSDTPGCRNIIEHDFNGLICKVKDPITLQQAMQQMLDMPADQRKRMCDNARRLVEERFDEQIVINAAVAAIESATGG